MQFAYWMILVAALLPYAMVAAARNGVAVDNSRPREAVARLDGWRRRAEWAQTNHFEAFPAFAAAVFVAELAHAPQGWIDGIAGLFVLIRLAYSAAYLGDRPSLRSGLWLCGFVCVLALFCIGL